MAEVVVPEHVISFLLLLERVTCFEPHELVQIEQDIEQYPGDVPFVRSGEV